MSKGKCIPFPADRFFDEEKYLDELVLQGEKDYIVCEYAMRVIFAINEAVKKGTDDVIFTINKDGEEACYLSVDKIKKMIQIQLISPV